MTDDDFTFVDLFAGIGGFHAALSGVGGRCLLAVEKDAEAARVYEDNWGMPALGDVTKEGWMDAVTEKVNVVCGGFPCQPFSKSGVQRGMDEARGTLFYNILECLEAWKPDVVLLENVRNLAGPRHRHEWEVIVASLRDLGYQVASEPLIVSPHWISPEEGGAPQNRERVYIVGTLVGREAAWAVAGELGTVQLSKWAGAARWNLERDLPVQAESELEEVELKELSWSKAEELWISAWSSLVEQLLAAGVELPRFPVWVDSWYSPVSSSAPAWKTAIEEKNRVFYRANWEMLDDWVGLWKVNSFPASRRKLEWQAGDARSFDECLVQLRPSGLRVKKATHTGALVAIDQRPFMVSRGRRLSIRECARLQRFPETFTFRSVSTRAAAKQLGNAVHVGSARKVFLEHLRAPQTRASLGAGHVLLGAAERA